MYERGIMYQSSHHQEELVLNPEIAKFQFPVIDNESVDRSL